MNTKFEFFFGLLRDFMKSVMTKENTAKELGTANIGRLLIQYSLPAIIATAASSIYNIVDRIFIGQGVGPYAISGLALTLPLMNIFAAFGAVIGVGSSTMVSIYLGQRNDEDAVHTLGNAFVLNIILSIITSVFGYIFLDDILMSMGASEMTLPYAREFMEIALIGNLLIHIYLGLNHIMRASGFPQKSMYITLTTVAINITLAPIYIFVFHWGIRGAALATLCAFINNEHSLSSWERSLSMPYDRMNLIPAPTVIAPIMFGVPLSRLSGSREG